MPMIIVRYVFPKPRLQLREQVAELARSLGHEVLGKDPNVTAGLAEEADPLGGSASSLRLDWVRRR